MKVALLLLAACYHHPDPVSYAGARPIDARDGRVVAVHEVAHAPPPADGQLVGGLVFDSGGAVMIGDGFGTAPRPDRHAFEVVVAFDNDQTGIFLYQDWSPFRPGERVLLTQQGLVAQ